MSDLSIYIHIPFCKSKCNYCSFYSVNCFDTVDLYIQKLKEEIRFWSEKIKDREVVSLFIGGGTPSSIDHSYITLIVEYLKHNLNVSRDLEFTLEVNPGTLSINKLKAYKSAGVNRLSIGLQATQNKYLKYLGRIHNYKEFLENYYEARSTGFYNINIDLIFGFPELKLKDWVGSLKCIINLAPEHISCYSLELEEGSRFYNFEKNGLLTIPSEEENREMYWNAVGFLEANKYSQYEISNFAKEKYVCRHNLAYWKYKEYLGFGPGAHSFFQHSRFCNPANVRRYLDFNFSENYKSSQVLDKPEQMREYIMLGLRMREGISLNNFQKKFDIRMQDKFKYEITELVSDGLLVVRNNRLSLTNSGLDLADYVIRNFL